MLTIKKEVDLMDLLINKDLNDCALSTLETVYNNGKLDSLELLIKDIYEENLTHTELSDFLWFEQDKIYEWLGIEEEE